MHGRPPEIGEALLHALWPAPAALGEPGAEVVGDYLVVPGSGRARFLLPRDPAAATSVLRHFRHAPTVSTRVRSAALRWGLRSTGGWPLTRDGFTVSVPPGRRVSTIETVLAETFDQPVRLGIHLGPPRANRKPVLQVLDLDNHPLGLAKLGAEPLTRALVEREGRTLAQLAETSLPGVEVPRALRVGDCNGAALLVMSALPLAAAVGRVPAAARTRAMATVARASGTRTERLADSPCLARLTSRLEGIEDLHVRRTVSEMLEEVAARGGRWEFGSWHGDWTVWNMAWTGERLLLWDWERHRTDVPVGWDALHFELRQALESEPPSLRLAQRFLGRAAEILTPFGVDPVDSGDIARTYLLEIAVRYLVDRQADSGEPSARVEDWLLPALPRHSPAGRDRA